MKTSKVFLEKLEHNLQLLQREQFFLKNIWIYLNENNLPVLMCGVQIVEFG